MTEIQISTSDSEGAVLLDAIERFLRRFVSYPSEHASAAHALWVAHCHLMDAWESTPRLAFLSPEKGCGKTRALEASELLVPRAVEAVNVTAAYLFRKIASNEDGPATILFDECDTVFHAKAQNCEEIRGLLNAGHRRGAMAGRCVIRGKSVEVEELPAYSAVAMAGIGDLPDTILSRSVIIRMKRRKAGEKVTPFRRRLVLDEGTSLRLQIEAWADAVRQHVTDAWPTMPEGIEDRNADVWEALLSVADAAGGHWPERARVAAVTFVTQSVEAPASLGVRLLADLRVVFADRDQMGTANILKQLCELAEAPWADLRGKPLNERGLATRLRPYDVRPKLIRIGEWVGRGYQRGDMLDAWQRYLPPAPTESITPVTPATALDPSMDHLFAGNGAGGEISTAADPDNPATYLADSEASNSEEHER